jgi:hypothetical protein
MRSKVTFCIIFASISVDFKSTEIESNRNFNDLILELSIQFDLISKVKIKSIDSIRNRIIARRKHDNAYAIACMIKINVITFLNRSNQRIKNAIRKKKNKQEKR